MLACLLLIMAAPIIMLFDESIREAIPFSPLTSLWYLAGGGMNRTTLPEWIAGLAPWIIALASWPLIARSLSCSKSLKRGTLTYMTHIVILYTLLIVDVAIFIVLLAHILLETQGYQRRDSPGWSSSFSFRIWAH